MISIETTLKLRYSVVLKKLLCGPKKESFEKIFVVGGEKIYRESLSSCEEIFLTEVDANFDGDTFFPEIEWDNWIAVEKSEWALAKNHELRYRFCHFKRKN